jgi:N-acyl-D-aspartate/D-glutamate deacylase
LEHRSSSEVIDAEGLVVAPGIVDAHTHYDPQITFDPTAAMSSYHGVTTVLAGNCGFSVAPTAPLDREYIQALFARVEEMHPNAMSAVKWNEFETFSDFRRSRDGRLGVNFACYVGHSTIRRWVMGKDANERAATPDEIQAMCDVVRGAMGAGAAGFSSSHSPTHLDGDERPVPSRLASKEELVALAAATGESGRGTITYLPSGVIRGYEKEDQDLLIELAQVSGLPIIIQGIGGRNKTDAPLHTWDRATEFFERARQNGAAIYSLLISRPSDRPIEFNDRNMHYRSVPTWHNMFRLPHHEIVELLQKSEAREELRNAVENYNRDPAKGTTNPPPPWTEVFVDSVSQPEHADLVGRKVSDIAAERSVAPGDFVLDLAAAEDLKATFRWSKANDQEWLEAVKVAQVHPQMLIGTSDGGAHLARHDSSDWSSWYLRNWVLDRKVWSLEEGIRQITQVPASLFGFRDRGTLELGKWADMFLFDPNRIAPGGTIFAENSLPGGAGRFKSYAVGIHATIVNGVPIIVDGEPTSSLPGQWVAPGDAK